MVSLPYANVNEPLSERFFHKPVKIKKIKIIKKCEVIIWQISCNIVPSYHGKCTRFKTLNN